MGDVVVFVEEKWDSSNSKSKSKNKRLWCRICHEEENESCKTLEAPCACSGTVKFAHRDCIQRWCDEKGNTTCEICLQKYEPDYRAPSISKKSQLIHEVAVTIRNSVETRRGGNGPQRQRQRRRIRLAAAASVDPQDQECTPPPHTAPSPCTFLALAFTVILLLKHLFCELSGGSGHHPFSLITVLFLKATGIILPMCVIVKTFTTIHHSIRKQYQSPNEDDSFTSDEEDEGDEDDRHQEHTV